MWYYGDYRSQVAVSEARYHAIQHGLTDNLTAVLDSLNIGGPSDEVTLYADSEPYSFTWARRKKGKAVTSGRLVYHGSDRSTRKGWEVVTC